MTRSFFNIVYTLLRSIFEPCYIQNCVITNCVIEVVVYWNKTYNFHPNYHTIKQYRSCQIKASVLFVYFFYKGVCCGYPSELHPQVDAI